MFTNEFDFVATGINALTANTKELHVLFSTYNCVAGYGDGPVNTGKEGLTIEVRNGDLEYSPVADLVYALGTPLAAIGAAAMEEDARDAEATLEAAIAIEAIESKDNGTLIVVVYAGLSAFDEAVAFARRIKQSQPGAKVVVVTCNCDLRYKEPVLEPMLQDKELEAVVVTPECGGRGTMRDILEGFVAAWPNNVPAVAAA
jgi:hypothetical protein